MQPMLMLTQVQYRVQYRVRICSNLRVPCRAVQLQAHGDSRQTVPQEQTQAPQSVNPKC